MHRHRLGEVVGQIQVEVAVIVQVCIGCARRYPGLVQSPLSRLLDKAAITVVLKNIIGIL